MNIHVLGKKVLSAPEISDKSFLFHSGFVVVVVWGFCLFVYFKWASKRLGLSFCNARNILVPLASSHWRIPSRGRMTVTLLPEQLLSAHAPQYPRKMVCLFLERGKHLPCSSKTVDVAINFTCINPFLQVLISRNIAWPIQQCSGHPALLQMSHHPSSNTQYSDPPQNIPSSHVTARGADIKLFWELKCK